MKRIACVLVAIMLLFSISPIPAFAANSSVGNNLSIRSVSATKSGSDAKVTVLATDSELGQYKLCIAIYDAQGKMLAMDVQDAVFSSTSMSFSSTFINVESADTVKSFFLTSDFQPVGCKGSTMAETAGNNFAALARKHVVKSLGSVSGVEAFSNHWYSDTHITADLSDSLGLIYSLTVSNVTSFDSAPETYDRDALIEWGKDHGLGVDILHRNGYTGKGAVIAYVDQPLNDPLHSEYEDVNLHYINTVTDGGGENSMHGPAVLSLLAGKDIGTAPDAEIYYYAHASWKADQTTHANCLSLIIEQNKLLSEDKKIRMVAFSDNIDESEANPEKLRAAVAACEEAGIMVWFCGEYGSASFLPMSDKSDPDNLAAARWNSRAPQLVFVPAGSRTTAATMGGAEYTYWSEGGLSWTMPYMLGLYAIAISIDTTLTQADIRTLVVDTAYTNASGMRIVNPVEFIAGVLDRVGKTAEADILRSEAKNDRQYLYAIMDTAQLSESDLTSIANYLSCITDSSVIVVDAAEYGNAASLYDAIKTDHASRGGTITGIQIFGTPDMVPAFSVKYKVQMASGVDEGGTFLTDIFYGNLNNNSKQIESGYNVCDHFAANQAVDLTPSWPVVRLPLHKGKYSTFFEKYCAFAAATELTRQKIVNFSNPIFASSNHIDDMGTFLNRMHDEFKLIDSDYILYGNQKGQFPVSTNVVGDFAADNLSAVNQTGIVEFLINSHGQRNNIDRCYFEGGEEYRESLINSTSINTVLNSNPYYLDCWTCNNAYGMSDNLVTTALAGKCIGAFAATTIISNNGVNCYASLADMQKSNFYYFYYQYLKELNTGKSRSQSFFSAQKAYAEALLDDSNNGIRGEGNYQFNLYNLIAYENFGVIEPNVVVMDMYNNAGYISQAGQSVPKDDVNPPDFENNALTDGTPIGSSWSVAYDVGSDCSIVESYTIYGLSAQQLDNGYIRVTLDYEAPPGLYVNAFNPPKGDLFMLYGNMTTGSRETFSYDVAYNTLKNCDGVTMKFFGGGMNEAECQYVFASTAAIIAGYDESQAPQLRTVDYFTVDQLSSSSVVVDSYQYEVLDSGDYRFYLTLTATEGMHTCLFDPPDGDLIKTFLDEATGVQQSYTFDIAASMLSSVDTIMFNVFTSDSDRFLIGLNTSDLHK